MPAPKYLQNADVKEHDAWSSRMGDTIKQAIGTLSSGSPEFKRALKVLIKYEIHCLLQRLSDTGEEAIVITTSIEDGIQEHLGTSKGEGFLRHTQTASQLKEQFRQYCTDDQHMDLGRAGSESPEDSIRSPPKYGSEGKPTTDNDEVETGVEDSEPGGLESKGPECQNEVEKSSGGLNENKPMDFSWKTEQIKPVNGQEKEHVDFNDRNTGKLSSESNYKDDSRSAFLHPFRCRLNPGMPPYLFSSATCTLKSQYEDSEVQDLSIHHRGSSVEKTENVSMSYSRKKRKSLKPFDQDTVSNGGLCSILPKHSENLSVIPRCHFDLSVSQIVENLSKAVGEKWTEDSSEYSEMEDSGLVENSALDKRHPVYFKCTETPIVKNGDFTDNKVGSSSKEALSWQREENVNMYSGCGDFDNLEPVNLKCEITDNAGLYKANELKDDTANEDICLLSEVKLEPNCEKACSDYDAMTQNSGGLKNSNQPGGHGTSPIQLNFICRICGQNFRNRQYRDFHVKLHRSAHSFLCNLCSAGFNSEAECTEHQKLHTDPVFQCDSCGYRCTREFRMRAHKEICGEPAKIYKCPYCDKQFAAQRYMRIHMKSHDTKNVHTCPYCQNSYPLKNSLLKHMKKKHSA